MEKCKYNGKAIYAFNVVGSNETINYNVEREWRKAGERDELLCDECDSPVIFRCGKIYKPHFAHKSEFQGGNHCAYSNETEEHIAGKKILLNYMQNIYPDVFAEIRYKLPERRKADLYFKFKDGQELIIEFQRQRLSVSYWDEKREFYKRLGLNNIWFLSGKREQFDELIREYQLSFWNRMVLNDSDNMILFLDIDTEEVTIIKKITVVNEESNEIIYDRLFSKTYQLNEIKILPDGSIECDFNEGFNLEKTKFAQAYLEQEKREQEQKERIKKAMEEQEKRRLEERAKRLKEEKEQMELLAKQKIEEREHEDKTDAFSEIGYNGKSFNPNTYKSYPKKSYTDYNKNDDYYKDKVNKAIWGYKYGVDNVVGILRRSGSTEYNTIKKLFHEQIDRGNLKAKAVFEEVMKKAGLD